MKVANLLKIRAERHLLDRRHVSRERICRAGRPGQSRPAMELSRRASSPRSQRASDRPPSPLSRPCRAIDGAEPAARACLLAPSPLRLQGDGCFARLDPRDSGPAPRACSPLGLQSQLPARPNTAVAPLDRLSRRQAARSQRSPPSARLGRSQGLWDDHPPRAEARDATCRPFLTVPADFWQEDRISVISQGFQPSLPAPARRPAKEGRRTPRRTLAYLDRHSEASQPARQPASWFPYL